MRLFARRLVMKQNTTFPFKPVSSSCEPTTRCLCVLVWIAADLDAVVDDLKCQVCGVSIHDKKAAVEQALADLRASLNTVDAKRAALAQLQDMQREFMSMATSTADMLNKAGVVRDCRTRVWRPRSSHPRIASLQRSSAATEALSVEMAGYCDNKPGVFCEYSFDDMWANCRIALLPRATGSGGARFQGGGRFASRGQVHCLQNVAAREARPDDEGHRRL